MLSIKRCLALVEKFEDDHNSLELLVNYLNNQNNLINSYYNGSVLLPSPQILLKLQEFFGRDIRSNLVLECLLEESIKTSKHFYSKLSILLTKHNKRHNKSFVDDFEKETNEIGQRLICLLKCLKYKLTFLGIKVVLPKNYVSSYITTQLANNRQVNYNLANSYRLVVNLITVASGTLYNFLYKFYLLQALNHKFMKYCYYTAMLLSLLFTILFLGIHKSITIYLISVITIALSIILCPIRDFGRTNILGKNEVADSYKSYLVFMYRNKVINRM